MPSAPASAQSGATLVPAVSVGLPVFNGARYLQEALDSLLAQSFKDFELVVVDNGSTDRTAEICQAYAALDPRVRVFRSERNRGAAWSHNRTIELARGEFFKLASHDDLHHPEFLEACVGALRNAPDGVLSHSRMAWIGARGEYLSAYTKELPSDASRPSERFRALVCVPHTGYQIFGVVRLEALRATRGFRGFMASDKIVGAELVLRGRHVKVDRELFYRRTHPEQSVAMSGGPEVFYRWWNSDVAPRIVFPEWRRVGESAMAAMQAPISARERVHCLRHVFWLAKKRRRELYRDLVRTRQLFKRRRRDSAGRQATTSVEPAQ